ncbi:MAG: nitroreductase family protein [Lewinellaceae bacterium]|nr:nitroreductase family protein [Lewinellaceae bacterium]
MEVYNDININQLKSADTSYPILTLLANRWSPRMFADKAVMRRELMALLEAARWAASSSNEQPWRFVYAFRGSHAYEKIFSCLSKFNQKWVRNAPILMITAIKEQFNSGKANYHALHDLGLAAGNMAVQAQSMGIALHHMAGVDWKKAQELLGVPDGFHVATAIAVGYYGGDPSALPDDLEETELTKRDRKPLEEIAIEGAWW